MKVCIFGAGAIGGYMAVMMKRGGVDVSLVARGPHLAAIKANGLKVVFKDKELSADMPATNDPRELGHQDYVIIALKAHQAWESVDQLKPLLGPNTVVSPHRTMCRGGNSMASTRSSPRCGSTVSIPATAS